MDIFTSYGDFLSGRRLDLSKRFSDPSSRLVDRIEYLRMQCHGKRVLHLGCLDHPEIIAQRMSEGSWLHGIITDVAEICLGVDVNTEGYELVRRQFGVTNIELLDLSIPLTKGELGPIEDTDWDLIICPEMLEHITNHNTFLNNLRKVATANTRLIITVPNAFSVANFIGALRGFEEVNTDHKYWFTFYTLSRLLADSGWTPRHLLYYDNTCGRRRWLNILAGFLCSRVSRMVATGLIVEAN